MCRRRVRNDIAGIAVQLDISQQRRNKFSATTHQRVLQPPILHQLLDLSDAQHHIRILQQLLQRLIPPFSILSNLFDQPLHLCPFLRRPVLSFSKRLVGLVPISQDILDLLTECIESLLTIVIWGAIVRVVGMVKVAPSLRAGQSTSVIADGTKRVVLVP